MSFEETLRRVLETLAHDLSTAVDGERAEASAQAAAEVRAVRDAAERDATAARAAAAEAAEAAERNAAARAAAEAAAEAAERDAVAARAAAEAAERDAAAARAAAEAAAERRGHQVGRDLGLDEGHRRGIEEGRQHGFQEGRAEGYEAGRSEAQASHGTTDLASANRLADAIRAIDRARSLSEILDTLAGCAGRETARAAVLLVRGSAIRGWRLIGFGPALDGGAAFEIGLADGGVIADAVRSQAAVAADGAGPSLSGAPPGHEGLVMPMTLGGEVVAVLYADQGPEDAGGRRARPAWPAALEVMTRHAARCLEAVTAVRAAQVLTDRRGPAAGAAGAAVPLAAVNSKADEEQQAARRYARLLVSEIKMYHEPEVIAGRRERDLGMRLGGEIARARSLYEQRVPPSVRGARDFFRDELVQTLAEGDDAILDVGR